MKTLLLTITLAGILAIMSATVNAGTGGPAIQTLDRLR